MVVVVAVVLVDETYGWQPTDASLEGAGKTGEVAACGMRKP